VAALMWRAGQIEDGTLGIGFGRKRLSTRIWQVCMHGESLSLFICTEQHSSGATYFCGAISPLLGIGRPCLIAIHCSRSILGSLLPTTTTTTTITLKRYFRDL